MSTIAILKIILKAERFLKGHIRTRLGWTMIRWVTILKHLQNLFTFGVVIIIQLHWHVMYPPTLLKSSARFQLIVSILFLISTAKKPQKSVVTFYSY